MADEVALALARLGEREQHTGDDDLVFCGPRGHVNAQKLGYRYKASTKRACFGQPSGSTGAIGNICGPPEPMPAQFGLSAFCTVRRLASVNEQTAIDLRLELAREQD